MKNGSRMTFSISLEGIRIFDNILIPSPLNLEFEFLPIRARKNNLENQILQDMTYEKMTFWLDNVCPGSVYVSSTNIWGLDMATELGNNLVMTPDEPMDDLLAILFHAKISAILKDYFIIQNMRVDGFPASRVKYDFVLTNEGYPLPNMVDFIGDEAREKEPCWWHRSDPTTFDLPEEVKESIDSPSIQLYSNLSFDEIEKSYEKILKECNLSKKKTSASIVDIAQWKPDSA